MNVKMYKGHRRLEGEGIGSPLYNGRDYSEALEQTLALKLKNLDF